MNENYFELTVTIPVLMLNHVSTHLKSDFEKLYRTHTVQKRENFPASVDLTLLYGRETLDELMRILAFLYRDSGNQPLPVRFGGREFHIQDSALHKYLERAVWDSERRLPGVSRKSIQQLIGENCIKDPAVFSGLAKHPFSGILPCDSVDLYCLTGDTGYLNGEKHPADTISMDEQGIFVLSNRYIDQSITIRTSGSVRFENCVITGKIDITDVETIHFYNCIVTGELITRNMNFLKLHSCNVRKMLICRTLREQTNRIEHIDFVNSKIFRLELYNSDVNYFDVRHCKIQESCMSELKISDPDFRSSQLVLSKITPDYMKDDRKIPPHFFFLTFQTMVQEKPVTPEEKALDTIDTLLKYCDFDHDHNTIAELKYRKMLYSNTGIRRFFVRLTGGYYKPGRWICYLLAVTLIFSIVYCLIPDGFVNTVDGDIYEMNFLDALQFTMLQIIGANTMAVSGTGLCQILTIIHASLNAAILGNFIGAISKRYMTI